MFDISLLADISSLELIHYVQELLAGIIGISIFIIIYPLWLLYKNSTLKWLSIWGGLLGSISMFHALTGLITLVPLIWLPAFYLPERMADSIILYFCVFPEHVRMRLLGIFIISIMITVIMVFYFPMHLYNEIAFVGRPLEMFQILPAALVLGSLTNVIKPMAKLVRWAVLCTLIGGLIMGLSHDLYDIFFVWAHNLKLGSYIILFFTVLWIKYKITKGIKGENGINEITGISGINGINGQ